MKAPHIVFVRHRVQTKNARIFCHTNTFTTRTDKLLPALAFGNSIVPFSLLCFCESCVKLDLRLGTIIAVSFNYSYTK